MDLTELHFAVRKRITDELLEDAFVCDASTTIDDVLNAMVVELRAKVFAPAPAVVTFEHPATWWDHIKHDLPDPLRRWVVARWPVRMVRDEVQVFKLALGVVAPPGRHVVHVETFREYAAVRKG